MYSIFDTAAVSIVRYIYKTRRAKSDQVIFPVRLGKMEEEEEEAVQLATRQPRRRA